MSEQPAGQPEDREQIQNLLRDFAKRPGCERYKADGEKLKMLMMYLWLRQLTDGLTFERFLERFEPHADYDDENLKDPEAALKHYCPRNKAKAEAAGLPQWSAAECVGIVALYVDMLREGERQGVETLMPFKKYLEMDAPGVKSGKIQLPKADPIRKSATKGEARVVRADPTPAAPETGLPPSGKGLQPTAAGQAVIYQRPSTNRQIRGVVDAIKTEDDRQYVDFTSYEGERFEACNIGHFTVLDEVPPAKREDVLVSGTLWVPVAEFTKAQTALALNQPMANVLVGDMIAQFSHTFAEQNLVVDVNILNGETGPFVDAMLCRADTEDVLVEATPRDNLLGTYSFELDEGLVSVEVKSRGQ
jgi:hypothetical protein